MDVGYWITEPKLHAHYWRGWGARWRLDRFSARLRLDRHGCFAAQIGLLSRKKALPKGRAVVIIWVRLGCPVRRQIFVTSSFPTFLRGPLRNQAHSELVYRRFQFQKRSQQLIGAHDETL